MQPVPWRLSHPQNMRPCLSRSFLFSPRGDRAVTKNESTDLIPVPTIPLSKDTLSLIRVERRGSEVRRDLGLNKRFACGL